MRSRLWLLAVLVVAPVSTVVGAGACDRAPLTRGAEPVPVPQDGGAEAGSVPAAVLDWAIPVGRAAGSGGATTLAAVVPLDDGGAVVAGTFTGTIGFGVLQVRGRNLVPNPPAIITAFISDHARSGGDCFMVYLGHKL